jgi:hypothetical protein
MNAPTSRRSFVALATGALASVAAGLGRAFGQGAIGPPDPQFDAAARDPLPENATVTTYTYDAKARLLSVTAPTRALPTTFHHADGSCV